MNGNKRVYEPVSQVVDDVNQSAKKEKCMSKRKKLAVKIGFTFFCIAGLFLCICYLISLGGYTENMNNRINNATNDSVGFGANFTNTSDLNLEMIKSFPVKSSIKGSFLNGIMSIFGYGSKNEHAFSSYMGMYDLNKEHGALPQTPFFVKNYEIKGGGFISSATNPDNIKKITLCYFNPNGNCNECNEFPNNNFLLGCIMMPGEKNLGNCILEIKESGSEVFNALKGYIDFYYLNQYPWMAKQPECKK